MFSLFPFQIGGDEGAQRHIRQRAEEAKEPSVRQRQSFVSRRAVYHRSYREKQEFRIRSSKLSPRPNGIRRIPE